MPAESAPRAGPAAALPRGKPERETKSSAPRSAEARRLEESRQRTAHWKRWGPYLSERQWGTVREDYSEDGRAWESFPHDHARSRAYRWGEDGLAGISDNHQRLCFALALWNGRDPILKERLFGLSGSEGNHGEDVKEYYFYLDSTPTHSYMKWLYKYPQRAYPYEGLVAENRRRGRAAPEFELLDTGVFEEDRYFDVQVEYAKASPDDILVRLTVWNRGPEPAELHLLPTLWFRNTWSWEIGAERPRLTVGPAAEGALCVVADHPTLGRRRLLCAGAPELLFTLRDVDHHELISQAVDAQHLDRALQGQADTALAGSDLGEIFGIDLDTNNDTKADRRRAKDTRNGSPTSSASPRAARKPTSVRGKAKKPEGMDPAQSMTASAARRANKPSPAKPRGKARAHA